MSKKRNSVLILTDSTDHVEKESLYWFAGHLHLNPLIDAVYVADRADPENAAFYWDLDPAINKFHVRQIDEHYRRDNARDPVRYPAQIIPADAFDTVWIRIDHPVSKEFLRYARALLPDHFFINDTRGLIHTISKEFLLELADVLGDAMPAVQLCNTVDDVEAFRAQFLEGVVLKQVLSYGGKGVVRYRPGAADSDLKDEDEVAQYLAANGTCLAMEYLNPGVKQSDNRVVIMNGHVVCVVQRTPQEGGWLCNLTSGGSAKNVPITPREADVAARLDPLMRKHGIFLYGADMLLNSRGERVLSELNTLNVGAIIESEDLSGKPLCKFVADNLARVIHARDFNIPVMDEQLIAA